MESVETIVINCGTKAQTTLALASALRNAPWPVTVIDCESSDGSEAHLRALANRLPFTLRSMPLRRHGDTLDRIFAASDRDALLLLDSDAEILSPELAPAMLAALSDRSYGSGFLHRGEWLGANHLVAQQVGYYAPRMWIPCVLLAVAPVKAALAAGASFRDRAVGNEVPQLPWLAQMLYLRWRVPLLRRLRFDGLRGLRRRHFGERPHYVYYDTGARMHEHLVEQQQLGFAALDPDRWPEWVAHHHGVTRRSLRRRMRNAADVDRTALEAIARIESIYGIDVPELRR